MAGRVAVFNGQFAGVRNLDKVEARLARLPEGLVAALQPAITKGANDFATATRAICPVAPEFERHPGELKESIHVEAGAVALGAKVVVDAEDEDGRYYAAHVEYGHRTKKGGHVSAKPFFWPSWQHEKRKIKAGISRAVTAVVKRFSA